jgi:hypothetical protein
VTFAIENSQILKKRAARNFQAKGGFPQKRTADRQTGNEREDGSEKSGRRKQEPRVEKHASEKEGESRNAIAGSEKQEGGERPGKQKRKREKKKKVPVKIGNGDLKTPILGEREVVAAATKRDRKRARKEHENGSKGTTALDLKMVAGVNSKTVQGEVLSSSKKDDRQSKSFRGKEQNREAGIRGNKKLQQTPPTKSLSLQVSIT